ncbi:metallophosphoesterase [Pedococcus aerophilus]|uniref:Metallophosphoesterase n=1 Tax=Pedococcus aerophilus TaxID=436356 RepID=A0ABP6H917_9MICO
MPLRLLRLGGVLALVAASIVGGVAATTLFPTSVDTLNYGAKLRLSINPTDLGTIQSPTIFGEIHLDFAGPVPAPGVIANVQVKERITDLLSRPNISISSLQPGPLELERAARDAGIGLALRFAAGALVVTLLALGSYAAWARRRPRASRLGVAAACWVIACAVTFASIGFGYRPERLDRFTTTGILGAVQRNADLLAGVETRAEQTTPYLKNLLALSSALQDKYSPQSLGEPVAARVLLVSDIHGANQYPLMKTIVAQEQIDAVIDAGDLVNFGTLAEAQASGVLDGIRSLDVPYVFVKGNHDARSASDTELLRALAKIPNVVLLQPDDDTYTVQSIGGIRIAGFNDPRWFGDDNRDNAAKQKAPAARFASAMADLAPPDVLVAHEPGAVDAVEQRSGIKVHGHLHSDRLDGNTIGVGTFTGGGAFSHFLQAGEGEELTGQPSSFDVAVFGEDCALTSLTRYQFRNVIEGRPAYDDVTLINGSRIESQLPPVPAPASTGATAEPSAPRTCSADAEPTTERVAAPPR